MNFKKILILFIVLFLIYFIIPKYNYFESMDGEVLVTKIEYSGLFSGRSIFFTKGKYTKWAVPDSYIQPILSGVDGGYEIFIDSDSDFNKVKIYACIGSFEEKNAEDILLFESSGSEEDFKFCQKLKNDNSGRYLYDYDKWLSQLIPFAVASSYVLNYIPRPLAALLPCLPPFVVAFGYLLNYNICLWLD